MIRKCRKWTKQETARTIVLLAEGKSMNEIGSLLNRSHHTVRANMAKVPGYVSRGRGRPKGGKCPKVILTGEPNAGWCAGTASKFLSLPMRVSP